MKSKVSSPFTLLKQMCEIHAPSGNEVAMKEFILGYVNSHKKQWKHKVQVVHGKEMQDCIILVFGKPRTAVFAHMDSIGYTVRYNNQLVKIGGPVVKKGVKLQGKDSKGSITGTLDIKSNKKTKQESIYLKSRRIVDTGTELTYVPNWRESDLSVQCCYMDNRLGVFTSLKVAEKLKDGIIVFSCCEEHGGGSVSFLQKYIQENYKVSQALIADVTWASEGVKPGKGVAISMRDSLVPRRSFINRIIKIATENEVPFQLEVEGSGGSDAKELQMAEYPWDWCFIGPPEENVHTPDEKLSKVDIYATIEMYNLLMKKL